MIGALVLSLRRFTYSVRLEAREARGTTALVLGIGLMITFGVALVAQREGFVLAFELKEAFTLAILAFSAFLPVVADIFAGSEERSARRAMASLPVSSGTIFGAQVCAALGAAMAIYAALCAGWSLAAAVLVSSRKGPLLGEGWEDFGGVAAALGEGGIHAVPLAAVAVTIFVAQVFRHALAATVAGWGTALALIALHFDAGIVDLGTRDAHFSPLNRALASSPWTLLALLAAFAFACRLRGSASRSWVVRSGRIVFVIGWSTATAAGAIQIRDWHRRSYDFYDTQAYISCAVPDVSGDGETIVVTLSKGDHRTGWAIDLFTQRPERITANVNMDVLNDRMLSPFDRGLVRTRTAIVRERVKFDGEWHQRVLEELWTSPFDGPAVVVQAVRVIPPRRRKPEIAYYLDANQRLHLVDLRTGEDLPTEHLVDGEAYSANIDEEGRWLTWRDATLRFRAIEIDTGQQLVYPSTGPFGRVTGNFSIASLGGAPILNSFSKDELTHVTIKNGEIVPLPLTRPYSYLVDVDDQHLVGFSRDNGLYLLGSNCEELAVLREPMPNALPKCP